MKKRLINIIVMALSVSCLSNKSTKIMDCEYDQIAVIENDVEIILSNPKIIQQVKQLVTDRKKELIKFKPKYWIQMGDTNCSLEFGVQANFIKIDGKSYVLKKDLEKIISDAILSKD